MGETAAIIGRRELAAVATLVVLVTILFFILHLVGSPLSLMMGERGTAEQAEAIRRQLGLDVPVWTRYVNYVADLARGDMGTSWRLNRPVVEMVFERVPATLTLGVLALALGMLIAIPFGLMSAVRPGSWVDNTSRIIAVISNSLPNFWLGILVIIVFAVHLRILPATGMGTWQHLVLPVFVLSTGTLPLLMRVTRASMLEVLNKDYVRTARSKGLPDSLVIRRHALRNAMIPVSTVIALRVGELVAGTMIIETVFGYPGVGRVTVEAMVYRDYPVVLAAVTLVAAAVLAVTLVADIVYTLLDPRVRVS